MPNIITQIKVNNTVYDSQDSRIDDNNLIGDVTDLKDNMIELTKRVQALENEINLEEVAV